MGTMLLVVVVNRPRMLSAIHMRDRVLRVVNVLFVNFSVVVVHVVVCQIMFLLWRMGRMVNMDTRWKSLTRFFRVGVVSMVSMMGVCVHCVRNGVAGIHDDELVFGRLVVMDGFPQGLFVNHWRLRMLLSHSAITEKIGHVCGMGSKLC